jgi:hypothetical protein
MSENAGRNYSRALEIFLLYSPVVAAILIMLPRLLSPQFGLLDDGKSIITAQDIARGDWSFHFDTTDARFRPLYWLSFVFLYIFVGEQPVWFFLLNTLVLCLTVTALMVFLRRQGATSWQAWLAGLFFVFSGAVIENYYTLSKGEWLQVLFIAISLFTITGYSSASVQRRKVLVVIGVSLLLFLAMISKETSVVMLPVSVVWAILGWLWAKHTESNKIAWRIPYVVSSTIAVSVYFLSRFVFISSAVSPSGYTERYLFTLSQLISSGVRWAGWLVRDYAFLAIVMLLATILLVSRRGFTQIQLAVDMLVWMTAWIMVYLPWNFMTEYYMLPFAFGAAVFAGLVLGDASTWHSRLTQVLGGLALILLISTVINNVTSARIQLTIDYANARVMEELSRLPRNASVYINIQSPNEYTDQIKKQLDTRFNRSDLNVGLFNPSAGMPDSCLPDTCYIVSPSIQNQPLLTVRMGVFEPTQEGWNFTLSDFLGKHKDWVEETGYRRSLQKLIFDFPRLFCAFVDTKAFCATPTPLIDRQLFQYGWTIYKRITQ